MINLRDANTLGSRWDELMNPHYVNQAGNIDWVVIGRGEPVPPMREIQAAGFDAIVQFRSDLMQEALTRSVQLSSAQIDYPGARSSTVEAEVNRVIQTEPIYGTQHAWPPRPTRVLVDLKPSVFEVMLYSPMILLEHGSPVRATIQWNVSINIILVETLESYAGRVDVESFRNAPPPFRDTLPVGSEPISVTRHLTDGTVSTSTQIELDVDPSHYRVDVVFDFNVDDLTLHSGSNVFDDLADMFLHEAVQDMLSSIGQATIAPTVLLGGVLRPDERLDGITRFEAIPVANRSNDGSYDVLSICIETGPGGRASDISRVRPFTGDQKYAYFVSENIAAAVVRNRWNHLSSRAKTMTRTIPIEIKVADEPQGNGHADIRYELKTLDAIVFEVGTENLPDSIMLSGTFESQAIRAWFKDRDITSDLGELREPHLASFLLHLYTFDAPFDPPDTETDRFLRHLARQLVQPILRPTNPEWRLKSGYMGSVSAPLSAVLTRGQLV